MPVLQVNIGCKTSTKIATAFTTLFQKVVISYPSKYPDPITDCITQDIGWEKVNISTLSLLASYRTLCTSSFDQDVDIVKNCFQPRQTLQTFDWWTQSKFLPYHLWIKSSFLDGTTRYTRSTTWVRPPRSDTRGYYSQNCSKKQEVDIFLFSLRRNAQTTLAN